MSQRVRIELVDDLSGAPIPSGEGGTFSFAWERKRYEIDLSAENYARLDAALAPFIAVARPARDHSKKQRPGEIAGGRHTGTRSRAGDAPAVREWAKNKGIEVSERGRIPESIVEAYRSSLSGDAENSLA